jgi:hypothetical protein
MFWTINQLAFKPDRVTWNSIDDATMTCTVCSSTFAKGAACGCSPDSVDDDAEPLTEAERMCADARRMKLPGRLELEQMLHAQRLTAQRRSRRCVAIAISLLPREDAPPVAPVAADGPGRPMSPYAAHDTAGRWMSIGAKFQDVAIKATRQALDLVSARERAAAIAEEERASRSALRGSNRKGKRKPPRAEA